MQQHRVSGEAIGVPDILRKASAMPSFSPNELYELSVFLAIVRYRSFRKAADQRWTSPPQPSAIASAVLRSG